MNQLRLLIFVFLVTSWAQALESSANENKTTDLSTAYEDYAEVLNRHKRQCACLSQYTPVNCKCQQADPINNNELACRCDRATVSPQCSCAPSASTLCFPVCQQQCIQSCVAQHQAVPQCQPPCQLICARACQQLPTATGSSPVYGTIQTMPVAGPQPIQLPVSSGNFGGQTVPVIYAIPQSPAGSPSPVYVPGVPMSQSGQPQCVPLCIDQCLKQCPNSPGQCAQSCTFGCQDACNRLATVSFQQPQQDVGDCSQRCEPSCLRACERLPSQTGSSQQRPIVLMTPQCEPACVSMCEANCQVNQPGPQTARLFESPPVACAPLCRPSCAPSCVQQFVELPETSVQRNEVSPPLFAPHQAGKGRTTLFESEYFIPLDGSSKDIIIPIHLPASAFRPAETFQLKLNRPPVTPTSSGDHEPEESKHEHPADETTTHAPVFEVPPASPPPMPVPQPLVATPRTQQLPWQSLFSPSTQTNRTTQYLKMGETTAEIHSAPLETEPPRMRGVPSTGDRQSTNSEARFQVDATVSQGPDEQNVQMSVPQPPQPPTEDQRRLAAAQQFTGFSRPTGFYSPDQTLAQAAYYQQLLNAQYAAQYQQQLMLQQQAAYYPQYASPQFMATGIASDPRAYGTSTPSPVEQTAGTSEQPETTTTSQPTTTTELTTQTPVTDSLRSQPRPTVPTPVQRQQPNYVTSPPVFSQNSYSPAASAHQYFQPPGYPTTQTTLARTQPIFGMPAYSPYPQTANYDPRVALPSRTFYPTARQSAGSVDPFAQPQNAPTDGNEVTLNIEFPDRNGQLPNDAEFRRQCAARCQPDCNVNCVQKYATNGIRVSAQEARHFFRHRYSSHRPTTLPPAPQTSKRVESKPADQSATNEKWSKRGRTQQPVDLKSTDYAGPKGRAMESTSGSSTQPRRPSVFFSPRTNATQWAEDADCLKSCDRVCRRACAKHRDYEDDNGHVCAKRCIDECSRQCSH